MPQRNGQNPIKRSFGQSGGKFSADSSAPAKAPIAGICPACKAEVPPKPGFRFSALKCPQCGAAMGKK